MYKLPMAAITNYDKFGGLKQHKFYSLIFLEIKEIVLQVHL